MSWHDNTVHGIRLRNPDEGYDFDLILDLDYILEWIQTPPNTFRFAVAPATLTFSGVDKLSIDVRLSHKESLIIDRIKREEITTEPEQKAGLRRYAWTISVHSSFEKQSQITFESPGYRQVLRRPPVIADQQGLDDDER